MKTQCKKKSAFRIRSVLLKKTGKMSKKWGLILMKGNLKLSKEITGSGSTWDSGKSKASHCIVTDKILFFKIEHKRMRQRALCNPWTEVLKYRKEGPTFFPEELWGGQLRIHPSQFLQFLVLFHMSAWNTGMCCVFWQGVILLLEATRLDFPIINSCDSFSPLVFIL